MRANLHAEINRLATLSEPNSEKSGAQIKETRWVRTTTEQRWSTPDRLSWSRKVPPDMLLCVSCSQAIRLLHMLLVNMRCRIGQACGQ
eukprot:2216032-Amphidinium_carterae.1